MLNVYVSVVLLNLIVPVLTQLVMMTSLHWEQIGQCSQLDGKDIHKFHIVSTEGKKLSKEFSLQRSFE